MSAVSTSPQATISRLLPALLLVLTIFGPISMDLYLPVLPALTLELDAATSIAQLTVTACLIGLAAGQLIAGPISDQYGRRTILIIGVAAYIVTSAACALSPSIELLIVARLVQGVAGGVGIVIAQAAGRDVYSGGKLIRFYGRLSIAGSVAAIIGPMIGGILSAFTDWRGLFLLLAAVGVIVLLLTLAIYRETLSAEHRIRGGFGQTLRDYRTLLGDRTFNATLLNQAFLWMGIFAYLAGATYILQDIYGLSPQWYAAAFGLNSAGGAIAGWIAGRVAERWSIVGALVIGIVIAAVGAAGLLVAGLVAVPVGVFIAVLFVFAFGALFVAPPATTLALADYPQMAGTASSLLGTVRFGAGGLAAPLVGIAGAGSILPLGIITVSVVILAGLASLLFLGRKLPHNGTDTASVETAA